MFLDIGWPEFMLIGIVALVVIGPKDLPRAMRIAGFWLRKARNLSRDFQNHIDQMIREAELDEVREDLRKATEFDIEGEFHRTIDPDGSLSESIRAPELPNYFVESDGMTAAGAAARLALPAPDVVAPEAPLPPDMPVPEFVGFEPEAAPAADAAAPTAIAEQAAAPVAEPAKP
jgi:sec-independent protein translocase protein TatB